MTPQNQIVIGNSGSERDKLIVDRVKAEFDKGTKICAITPDNKSIDKYNGIISRAKSFNPQNASNDQIGLRIDRAFDEFLQMGFIEPLASPSLLILEDFDRLSLEIERDKRLHNRLYDLIEFAKNKKISVWIISSSIPILTSKKYSKNLAWFERSMLLTLEDFNKTSLNEWDILCDFLNTKLSNRVTFSRDIEKSLAESKLETCLYTSTLQLWKSL